jgi:hypothetical protein
VPSGRPRTDVERAIAHYGITEEEYCRDPSAYPLPERGMGLNPGIPFSYFIIMGIIGYFVYRALTRRGATSG